MTSVVGFFENYNRQARLYPSLLALLPPLVTLLAWFPNLLTSNLGTTLVTLASSCGLLFGLSVFSRSCGKRTEYRLLKKWGSWPTTQWLRHRDNHVSATTKQRYYQALKKRIPNLHFPTASEEAANPAAADEVFSSAIDWLKEHTRSKEFSLILKENIEYGFRRNMRGIRPYAIGAIAVCLSASACGAYYRLSHLPTLSVSSVAQQFSVSVIGATLFLLIALLGWIVFATDSWVRQAGVQYTRALLSACETL